MQAARQSIAVTDIDALIAFVETSQNMGCIKDVLHMVIHAVSRKQLFVSFLEQIKLIEGFHLFVNFLERYYLCQLLLIFGGVHRI